MTEPNSSSNNGNPVDDVAIAARMRRQARTMRIVNVPMRRLLRLPFPTPLSRRLMLLTYTGRKTGRVYNQPVSYVADGDTLLSPGGGKWKLNLRGDQPIQLRLHGRGRPATAELVRDPAEVDRLLHTMLAANPRLASFMPVVGPDKQIDESMLTNALEHGFCIVRWHLDESPQRGGLAP
ncbi:MAG: nitroreductase/quinone reductase family protein [Jatrophihabitantaceae bacterium]